MPKILAGIDIFSPENVAGFIATAIVAILGFLITWLFISLILRPIKKSLKENRQETGKVLDEVEQAHVALAQARETLRQEEAAWQEEKARLITESNKAAAKEREKIMEEAHEEARVVLERAREQAQALHSDEEQKVKARVTHLTMRVLEEVLHRDDADETKVLELTEQLQKKEL